MRYWRKICTLWWKRIQFRNAVEPVTKRLRNNFQPGLRSIKRVSVWKYITALCEERFSKSPDRSVPRTVIDGRRWNDELTFVEPFSFPKSSSRQKINSFTVSREKSRRIEYLGVCVSSDFILMECRLRCTKMQNVDFKRNAAPRRRELVSIILRNETTFPIGISDSLCVYVRTLVDFTWKVLINPNYHRFNPFNRSETCIALKIWQQTFEKLYKYLEDIK